MYMQGARCTTVSKIRNIFLIIDGMLSPFLHGDFFSHEQARSDCDWVVMSSVFFDSQSSCFFHFSREQIRLVENRLKVMQLCVSRITQKKNIKSI